MKAQPSPEMMLAAILAPRRVVPPPILDAILATQFTVAWAGEGRCQPRRLGWWNTDLIDPDGGGDLLSRLLPQTHAWASIEAVREAARRVDAKARSRMAAPDKMRSIFFLGFDVDEQLRDRLQGHKRAKVAPVEALPLGLPLNAAFSREQLAAVLGPAVAFEISGTGRQISGSWPDNPEVLVQLLAGALIPFAEAYPLPFIELTGIE